MLILRRAARENIVIDGRIIVTAVTVGDHSAQIKISGAEGLFVHRPDCTAPFDPQGELLTLDEMIHIGDAIVVKALGFTRDVNLSVRLGIQAPAEVPVHRQEIFDAIERDKRERKAAIERAQKASVVPKPQ